MPDNSTITLDGFGGAGDGKTYVVNGANITIFDGETSTTYGIDVANKQFLGKSVFAGYTFSGTYYNEWDEANASVRIVFADSSTISGTIYSGYGTSFYFEFTAELDGNTIVYTIVKSVDSGSVGKTLKATISGDTITFVKGGTFNSNVYTFTNKGSAKCEGFSL